MMAYEGVGTKLTKQLVIMGGEKELVQRVSSSAAQGPLWTLVIPFKIKKLKWKTRRFPCTHLKYA